MSILRDIFRRKARSILTMTGISIGVLALVVLGAVAENQNVYVEKLVGYYSGVITVIEKNDANFVGMASGNRPLSASMRDDLEAYPGVRAAYPDAATLLDEDYVSVIPPMVMGVAPGMMKDYVSVTMREGRMLYGDERGEVMLGVDLATNREAKVGDNFDIRGRQFTVAGIMDRTFVNLIDSAAYVSLKDAQNIYYSTLPAAFRANVKAEDLAVQYSVHVEKGVDPDRLAEQLERDFNGIKATGPAEMMKTVSGLVNLINAVIVSVAALALIVCVLSIINTMMMAVGERTREIGIKRALGASRWRVARDVLAESSVMGLLGGVLGLTVGAVLAVALNSAMVAATGTSALLMTFRLAVTAIVFAVLLGLIGGLWPARHASKLDPATALAYE